MFSLFYKHQQRNKSRKKRTEKKSFVLVYSQDSKFLPQGIVPLPTKNPWPRGLYATNPIPSSLHNFSYPNTLSLYKHIKICKNCNLYLFIWLRRIRKEIIPVLISKAHQKLILWIWNYLQSGSISSSMSLETKVTIPQ